MKHGRLVRIPELPQSLSRRTKSNRVRGGEPLSSKLYLTHCGIRGVARTIQSRAPEGKSNLIEERSDGASDPNSLPVPAESLARTVGPTVRASLEIFVPPELVSPVQPLSLPEFRRLLRAQDAESLLDLVCALRRARGDDCTLREGVVEATNPRTGESERIAVGVRRLFRPSISADRADVVVATWDTDDMRRAARERSAEFVGPDCLREQLLYGVDLDTRRELFRTYFDWEPTVEANDDNRSTAVRVEPLVTAVAVVALVALAALGGSTLFGVDHAPAAVETPTRDASTGTQTDTAGRKTASSLPPGVNESGVADVTTLAVAHGRSIRDASYRLTLSRRITTADNQTGSRVQAGFRRIAVNDTMRFRTQSGGNISITEGGFGSLSVGVYADGQEVYRRVPRGNGSVFLTGPAMRSGRFSNQVQRNVIVYLGTNQTNVSVRTNQTSETDSATRTEVTEYVVTATGSPNVTSEPIRNYTAVAVVRSDGFVRSLNVSYNRMQNGRVEHVTFGLVYTQVGGVEIRTPEWYDRARNATAEAA